MGATPGSSIFAVLGYLKILHKMARSACRVGFLRCVDWVRKRRLRDIQKEIFTK
jgi:hypothetical protein